MRSTTIFQFRKHPTIDKEAIKSEYKLNEEDGEFWVIAYAISKAPDKILVVIDDGPALNSIYIGKEKHQPCFEVWTSIHIIFSLMNRDILTKDIGSKLFHKFYDAFSKKLGKDVVEKLLINDMYTDINSKSFRRRVTERIKNMEVYGPSDTNSNPHWHYHSS